MKNKLDINQKCVTNLQTKDERCEDVMSLLYTSSYWGLEMTGILIQCHYNNKEGNCTEMSSNLH